MASPQANPLLSALKQSDSPLAVKLHPLVLLTITDYVTRHSLTSKTGPIIGAVIGQQNGREVTMEHAFESATTSQTGNDGLDRVLVEEPWFGERLKQYKDVHADPALDLTAVFTLGPTTGPLPEHVPLVQYLKQTYNDDVILVLFHPQAVLDGSLKGGKLPITLYESLYEPGTEDADKGLQIDSPGTGRHLQLKFRELPFEVETSDAEMIGVDHVAKGAANANLTVDSSRKASTAKSAKGKAAITAQVADDDFLSPMDEELIATLSSKASAIKMLRTRISLLRAYLSALPPSYLTDPSLHPTPDTNLNHPLLRQIAALRSRLPLLNPPTADGSATTDEVDQTADTHLVSLLASLTRTMGATRELTTKSSVVMRARNDKKMAALAREAQDGPENRFAGVGGGRKLGKGPAGGAAGNGPLWDPSGEGGFDSGADGPDY